MCSCGTLIGCVVLGACCCCILPAAVGGGIYYAFGPLLTAGAKVAQCVDDTLEVEHTGFAKDLTKDKGPCVELGNLNCDPSKESHFHPPGPSGRRLYARKLEEDPLAATCHKLEIQCGCAFAESLAGLHDPTLEDGLKKCCKKVEGLEEEVEKNVPGLNVSDIMHQILHLDGSAVQQCRQVVDNVTGEIEKFAEECKKGTAEDYKLPPQLDALIKSHSEGEGHSIAVEKEEKFVAMGKLFDQLRSKHSTGLSIMAVAGSLVMLMAASMFAVLRTRQHSASHSVLRNSQDQNLSSVLVQRQTATQGIELEQSALE